MTISWRTVYQDELDGRELEVRRSSEGVYRVLTRRPEPALASGDGDAAEPDEAVDEALNRDGLVEALLELEFSSNAAARVVAALRC